MKIIYIGNQHTKHSGLRHALFDMRFYNGLVRNNHWVKFFSPKEEQKLSSPFLPQVFNKNGADKALLKLVKNFTPDVILWGHAEDLNDETFLTLRQNYPHIKIASLNVDCLFSPRNLENLKRKAPLVDALFITSGGVETLEDYKGRAFFIPNITDSSIDTGRAFENPAPLYDVSCFMNTNDSDADHQERLSLARAVKNNLPELKTLYTGFDGQGGLYGQAYIETLGQSAMSLNLSRQMCGGFSSTPQTRALYSSDRLAHIMGNGSLALTSDVFGLEKLYTPDEVVYFHDEKELIDKVRFYKNNPEARQKIAYNGWKKSHEHLNSTLVMQYVVEKLTGQSHKQNYIWL